MAEQYKDYVSVGVKMPQELKDKIKRLAAGSGKTFNGWAVRALAREARWGEGARKK